MDPFNVYLEKSLEAAQTKYPGENFLFYNGEYRPDINNFNYEYNFASTQMGVKVTVNTYPGGEQFIVMKIPGQYVRELDPIKLPVTFTLMQAYQLAVEKGFRPDLGDSITFLQSQRSTQGPAYWFQEEGSDTEWILVQLAEPHRILESASLKPVNPR